jgi:large subunit ribosomal protein L6
MSRIGSRDLLLGNAKFSIVNGIMKIEGECGVNTVTIPSFCTVINNDGKISVTVADPDELHERKMWGTVNALIKNAIEGVNNRFLRSVKVDGIGYAIDILPGKLNFRLGYSHPLLIDVPKDMEVIKKTGTSIELKHHDKQFLNQFVMNLCFLRKVNIYSGKGVYADGLFVRRKEVVKK